MYVKDSTVIIPVFSLSPADCRLIQFHDDANISFIYVFRIHALTQRSRHLSSCQNLKHPMSPTAVLNICMYYDFFIVAVEWHC